MNINLDWLVIYEVCFEVLKAVKLHSLVVFGLVSLSLISCAPSEGVSQSAKSPTAQTSVESSTPSADSNPASTAKSGTFVSGEHSTEGTARLVKENGKRYLELDEAFKTSEMGPDLHVILHRSEDVIGSTNPPAYPLKEGDYVILGRLEKFNGAQRYSIPENINLADYQSAVIWCRKFNATFGAAKLS